MEGAFSLGSLYLSVVWVLGKNDGRAPGFPVDKGLLLVCSLLFGWVYRNLRRRKIIGSFVVRIAYRC